MQDSEVSRIAKELNMTEADVSRLGKIVDKIMADKEPYINENPDWIESEEVSEGGY
jgi:hypothetical protein